MAEPDEPEGPGSNRTRLEESAIRAAGFTDREAAWLASLSSLAAPVTFAVAVISIVWIGIHLWPDLDSHRWQVWADENPAFFEPLRPGDTVAIVPDLHSHSGLTVTRTTDGVRVRRRLWFPFEDTPVGLVVDPEAADRWLRLRYRDDGFWRQWHELAKDPGISVYQHIRRGPHPTDGYTGFLEQLR